MHLLTQAAIQSLEELWLMVHEQPAQPAHQASLWRMAGNVCTGYALQHRGAQDDESADAFAWLALICDERQLIARQPAALRNTDKLRLAVVQALPRTH